MKKAVLVLVTVPNRKEANKIATALVDEKLAACVSAFPEITSRYRWKGAVETSREVLILIKTMASNYKRVERRILQLHSYEVPEILAIPIRAGNPAYLKWLRDCV